MPEVSSSGGSNLSNRTFIENKDYGYQNGARSIEESKIHPYDFGDKAEGPYLSLAFVTKVGGYTL